MNHKEAHFLHRLLANSIDNCLYLAINLYVANTVVRSPDIPSLITNLFLFLLVLLSPIGLLNTIFFTWWFGGTIGKLLTGIKITSLERNSLSFKRILFRQTIGYMFSGLLFGLGYFAILKNDKRQGWHDQAVGSLVIKTNNFWIIGLLVCLAMLGTLTYFGAQTVKTALANEPLKQSFISIYQQILSERTPGSLQINSDPKSNITINGEDKGNTPFEDKNLKPGDYKIILKSNDPNTVTWEGIATVNKNTTTIIYRDLKKEIVAGEILTLESGTGLRVTSNPSEAKISIDGKEQGKTPFIKEDLSVGEHEVILEKAGSLGRVIKINVLDKYQTHLAMDLGPDNTPTPISPSKPTTPVQVFKYTEEDITFWKGELDWTTEQLGALQTWKNTNKDQTKVDRMIAIETEQKNIASTLYNKMIKKELLTSADNALPGKYDKLSYEYGTLLKETLGN